MNDGAYGGGHKVGADKGGEGVGPAAQAQEDGLGGAAYEPAQDHVKDHADEDGRQMCHMPADQQRIEQSGEHAVGAQLKGHGHGGRRRGHAEDDHAQERCDEPDHGTGGGAAGEPGDKGRDVHG